MTWHRFNLRQPLRTLEQRYVLREPQAADLFEATEQVYVDEIDGIKTVAEQTVYLAGCGHLVGFVGPVELISRCSGCGVSLCFRCGNLRCRRCLKLLCQTCAKVVDESLVYCAPCRRIATGVRGLKYLHRLCTKELE